MSNAFAHLVPPPLVVPDDWERFSPFPLTETPLSFVSGANALSRFRVAYYRRGADDHLYGRAWFGPESEGPPGHAHGGAMSAVLDEMLGGAAWAVGHPVVVGRLEVDFRAMVPLGCDTFFEAWVDRVAGRKIHTHGWLKGEDGTLYAEGKALCVTLSIDHFERFKEERQAAKTRRTNVA